MVNLSYKWFHCCFIGSEETLFLSCHTTAWEPTRVQNWVASLLYVMDPYVTTQLEIAIFSLCDNCVLNLVIEKWMHA